ncbi:MAG TPA: VOC family protein [Rhodocyclaceae bacterium]
MSIQPYLFFDGCCEEAIGFYRRVLDAEVQMLMRYREAPEPPPPDVVAPGMEDKVMHASLRVGDSVVMMSDDCTGGTSHFEGFQLSLGVADAGEAQRRFAALAEGGQVKAPLGKTFFSPAFGMVTDRFGVSWMVIVPQQS